MRTVIAVTSVAALSASVVIATAGGQEPRGRTLVLTELTKQASFGLVDNPPKAKLTSEGEPARFSAGDAEVFSIPVADRQGNRVGRLAGHCVIARPGTPRAHEEVCTAVYRLKDGQISITAALIGETAKYSAAVTGGTGAYQGVRGTMRSVTTKRGTTDTLRLVP